MAIGTMLFSFRSAASEIMPLLLQSGSVRGAEYVKDKWSVIFPALIEAIGSEVEPDVCGEHLHALAKVRISFC